MKKLVLALFVTVALASCGHKAPVEADTTVTETEIVMDSTAVDSTVMDTTTVVVDGIMTCE